MEKATGAASEMKAGVTQAVQAASSENKPAETIAPASADTAQAQGLIDKAKSSVADKKYQEALDSLKELASTKLTPDQQKMVEDLKTQIQTGLAKGAGASKAQPTSSSHGLREKPSSIKSPHNKTT
jgi:hypothetical protein